MRDTDSARLDGESVLVTGAGGFIGSALVRALLLRGASVRALAGAPGQETLELPAEVTPVHADIEDQEVLRSIATGVTVAIHLAGPPSVAASFEVPHEYGRVHAGGTLAVLEASRLAQIRRFVYLSSAEVYGRSGVPHVTEDHPLQPRSPYAASKAAGEEFVGAYARAFDMQTFILRPFSVYGPGLRQHSVLGVILRQALWDDEVVMADLGPVRDYVFVDDVVDGILRAATVPSSGAVTVNLGSGTGTSVGALAELAVKLVGRNLSIRSDPARRRPASADIHHLVADPTRAAAVLRWSPAVSLEQGLLRTLRWMEAHR